MKTRGWMIPFAVAWCLYIPSFFLPAFHVDMGAWDHDQQPMPGWQCALSSAQLFLNPVMGLQFTANLVMIVAPWFLFRKIDRSPRWLLVFAVIACFATFLEMSSEHVYRGYYQWSLSIVLMVATLFSRFFPRIGLSIAGILLLGIIGVITPLGVTQRMALHVLDRGRLASGFTRHAAAGDTFMIHLYFWAGVDVDIENGEQTALLRTAGRGHLPAIKLLLDHGAKVNIARRYRGTPLTRALGSDGFVGATRPEVALLLLKYGADVNLTSTKTTPLMLAAECGYVDVVDELIKKGADVNAHDDTDNSGQTAVFYAVRGGHLPVVIRLAKAGADLQARNSHGETCLFAAAHSGSVEMARYLIDQGLSVHAYGDSRETPLFDACRKGHLEIVRLLLKQGADVNHTNQSGQTALQVSVGEKQIAIVTELTKHGADSGETLLFDACREGHLEIVRLLLKQGADVNHTNQSGQTALHVSVEKKRVAVVTELINQGADVCAKDFGGESVLFYAAEAGDPEIVKLLAQHGADVNLRGPGGKTALMEAARLDRATAVEVLLEAGADAHAKNDRALTARMIAEETKNSRGGFFVAPWSF